MKSKVFVSVIIFLLNLCNVYSQDSSVKFLIQSDGTMLTEDGKGYQIIIFDGESQEEIFNKLIIGVTAIFVDPKSVISTVENQLISISGVRGIQRDVGGLWGNSMVYFHYVIKIHIKEGRVKVDSPSFSLLSFDSGYIQDDIPGWLVAQKIFTKDGQPNKKKEIYYDFYNRVNESFSSLINQILNYSASNEEW